MSEKEKKSDLYICIYIDRESTEREKKCVCMRKTYQQFKNN